MKTKTSQKVPTPFSLRQSASRSFPLGSILVLVALTSCCLIQPGTELVFTTLAPNCTYYPDNGIDLISGPPTPGVAEYAAKFTAMTSGNLATVHLGMTHCTQTKLPGGPVGVFLCRDAAGLPNIATQTYLGTVAPTEWFGTTNNTVVRLVVAGKVPVVQGLDYWLVLKPAALEYNCDIWNTSIEMFGSAVDSWDGGVTWRTFNEPRALPAFGITAWPRPWADFFRDRVYEEVKVF